MAQTSPEICPFCLCLLCSVTCVGAGVGHQWVGFHSLALLAPVGFWPEQPGSRARPCSPRGRPGNQLWFHLPAVSSSPAVCLHSPVCVREGITPAFEQLLAQPGAVPISAVPFSLSVVRSRVPEAEGEELLVSLWAALHRDAHQGESFAVAGGCFWWGFYPKGCLECK